LVAERCDPAASPKRTICRTRSILEKDILRIEEQIDSWRAVTGIPIVGIHYDALWDAADILEDFLGFPVPLPHRRPRGSEKMDPLLVAKVRQNYARLDHIVEKLPPYWWSDGCH
jgi:hypothetical protein